MTDKGYHLEKLTWKGRVERTFGTSVIKALKGEITKGRVLDVGSSVGDTTHDLSSIFGSETKVFGIEVDMKMFISGEERKRAERLASLFGYFTSAEERRKYTEGGTPPVIFAGDGYNPPFAKNSFEAVFMMNNLYQSVQQGNLFGKRLDDVMKNVSDIVKPGFFLCISGTEGSGDPFVIYRFDKEKRPHIFKKKFVNGNGKDVLSRISNAMGIEVEW